MAGDFSIAFAVPLPVSFGYTKWRNKRILYTQYNHPFDELLLLTSFSCDTYAKLILIIEKYNLTGRKLNTSQVCGNAFARSGPVCCSN